MGVNIFVVVTRRQVAEFPGEAAAAGIKKFPAFVEARKKNWAYLRKALNKFSGKLVLPEPTPKSDPSWFGFLVTVKDNAGFTRDQLVAHLEANKIQTRMLFAGNLIKHPCFDEMRKTGKGFRVVSGESSNLPVLQSSLPVTDRILNNTFWIGVYPGMTPAMLKYIAGVFTYFFARPA